ncbi:MAG: iron-containing alcohol dehydrogenase [Gammaproteobacteria bacterium]|jgi:alcohol dehydrogenase|nr:iron-containing alcohol dehydrogenase [Gammaproteobacteria bacterium]MBT3722129.1 iron-containing alcohol dehydrogenase [Gammaproteobacteria bacterium]MBT4077269.1 iron-containing alcohol dehydrogenase [Gammaproteobacteria bacterium]MBT4194620.1 iron-containing alcohol dehydrogenase [Gammaproteobacteria bacterium]MBT4448894.1 iron-containing alcohol dehydrogenase [Gammaproteobacteria bacterium]
MQFSLSHLPEILFGSGKLQLLPEVISQFGNQVLLVTGGSSWAKAGWWPQLIDSLQSAGIHYEQVMVAGEPSPELVDDAVKQFCESKIDVVVAVGGGSALDAGKAIAGLLKINHSVMDYLEGVGPELKYTGPAVPFIALPTTAGTGSEATKNAVLSRLGPGGFKKSFRDDLLMAKVAIVDPDLLVSCPPSVIAANGMDALTQLMESYVSTRQNTFCNALSEQAIRAVRDGLLLLYQSAEKNPQARENMAFASMVSGINLAQTGLGSVHGLASPLGAFYPIPHGVVCGSLLAEATEMNIRTMLQREPDNPALESYKKIAQMLCGKHFSDVHIAFDELFKVLRDWTQQLEISHLSRYGVNESDIERIVQNVSPSSMRTNPIRLTDEEIAAIVRARL